MVSVVTYKNTSLMEEKEVSTGMMHMEEKEVKVANDGINARKYICIIIILVILCIALLIAVIVLAVKLPTSCSHNADRQNVSHNADGQNVSHNADGQNINLQESQNPSVFHDLTTKELTGLTDYLYSVASLNLADPSTFQVNSNYVYLAEVYLPSKSEVLNFLDNGGQKPDREAIVTIFRGDEAVPDIQEIIVGPLPVPTRHRVKQTTPFEYRPFTIAEHIGVQEYLKNTLHNLAGDILFENYGGKLKDCESKCLVFKTIVPMSPAITGEKRRKCWYVLSQFIEYYSLHNLDFAILLDMDKQRYTVDQVWYNGHTFKNIADFVSSYTNNNNITKTKMDFTADSMFSKLSLRHPSFPSKPLRNPVQLEPDGKRYSINDRHVTYMNWDFDFRMSTSFGPQLFDIRYKNERIVYEVSLQELAVFYSANKAIHKFTDTFDSLGLLGDQAKPLVPGSDCPGHATFIDGLHYKEPFKFPLPLKRQFCLFEHNTGEPLRRHHSAYSDDGMFYEGMESVVLILRTIISMGNYDYIVNFIFYPNGAMQVKVVSTGFVLTNQHSEGEAEYGFQIHDNINANLHLHLFNFKVDLDIKGETNRYETLDITSDETENEYSVIPNTKYVQTKFSRNVKTSEREAAYKFNFDTPKYHLFYNEMNKNKYLSPKSYRILTTGMAKQLIPEGTGNEPKLSWARYQLAVTKLKDTERRSSSVYAIYDSADPVVNFDEFLKDNETIIDQDLVTWITLGIHHIPHTEDLPVTHTPGMDLSFYLLPYNYFEEDPSMASLNAIRIEPKDRSNLESGLNIEKYGVPDGTTCAPNSEDNQFFDEIRQYPIIMFH